VGGWQLSSQKCFLVLNRILVIVIGDPCTACIATAQQSNCMQHNNTAKRSTAALLAAAQQQAVTTQ
jgi:hypothetical protein